MHRLDRQRRDRGTARTNAPSPSSGISVGASTQHGSNRLGLDLRDLQTDRRQRRRRSGRIAAPGTTGSTGVDLVANGGNAGWATARSTRSSTATTRGRPGAARAARRRSRRRATALIYQAIPLRARQRARLEHRQVRSTAVLGRKRPRLRQLDAGRRLARRDGAAVDLTLGQGGAQSCRPSSWLRGRLPRHGVGRLPEPARAGRERHSSRSRSPARARGRSATG